MLIFAICLEPLLEWIPSLQQLLPHKKRCTSCPYRKNSAYQQCASIQESGKHPTIASWKSSYLYPWLKSGTITYRKGKKSNKRKLYQNLIILLT